MTLVEALKANNENLAIYRELGDERAIEFCLNLKKNILKSMEAEELGIEVELFLGNPFCAVAYAKSVT